MQQPQRRFTDLGFARRVPGAFGVVLVTDRGEHHSGPGPVVSAPDHDDGRRGACGDLQTDRSEHEVLEPAETAVAHYDSAAQAGGSVQAGDGCAAAELRGDVQTGIVFRDGSGGFP